MRFIWVLALLASAPAWAQQVDVYEVRTATFPSNPENFARDSWTHDTLTLTAGFGPTGDWGFSVIGARMNAPAVLELQVRLSGTYAPMDANAVAGVVVDFHSPGGYLKRVLYEIGPPAPKRDDFIPIWGKSTAPDEIRRPLVGDDGKVTLHLASDAPIAWEGRIWLSVLLENSGRDTSFSVTIPGVKRVDAPAEARGAPVAPVEPVSWTFVPLEGRSLATGALDDAQALARDKLKTRARLTKTTALNEPARSPGIVIGTPAELAPILGETTAETCRADLADPLPWRHEQGYVIAYDAEADLLVACAEGRRGLIYAMAHLERGVVDAPTPAIALESSKMVEKPKLEERGIYINIGYGLSCGPLTVDNWDEARWERFIDDLVLSRATFWSWYLWTEIEHLYPGQTPEYAEKNARVHRMLRHAIDYSQRRGLRAVFLYTPTNIPADMVAAHPDWKTTLEYVNHGGICSRVPQAYEAAKAVHRHQTEYFADANEFDIAFYDCGGCMCLECRKGDVQLEQLLKQIQDFSAITWEVNPDARFGFWTWAVWRYERIHEYSLRNRLIPQAAAILKGKENRVVVIDSFHGDVGSVPYFEEARKHGFRTSNFVYQTNIEDGQVFVLPLMAFQQQWAARAQKAGLDESFLMTMEVGAKYPTAHFGAEVFWDADLTPDRMAGRYALQITGHPEAARLLQQGLMALERLSYYGAAGLDDYLTEAATARTCILDAVAMLPPERQADLRWLVTTARAYDLIYRAVEPRSKGDSAKLEALFHEMKSLTLEDPQFATFGERLTPEIFGQFIGWFGNGFKNGYF